MTSKKFNAIYNFFRYLFLTVANSLVRVSVHYKIEPGFSMDHIRENKHKQLTNRKAAMRFVRTATAMCTARTVAVKLLAGWSKEANP